MVNFLVRLILFLFGLVFAVSLAIAVLLLAMVWGLRYAWCRFTGKPVQPWVMRFDPRSGFDRFRAASRPQEPTAADIVGARARGQATDSPVRLGQSDNVTDVAVKPDRGD